MFDDDDADPMVSRSDANTSHAMIDSNGRLVSAEPALDALNRTAGGAPGLPLGPASLATIARLAHRLGVEVSRRVVVADDEGDVDLWVRAEPTADGVRLAASGWHRRPGRPLTRQARTIESGARADGGWRWDTDAALRLIRLSPEAGPRYGLETTALLGQPITMLFTLENGDGQLPLIDPFTRRESMVGQRARLHDRTAAVMLSATILEDPAGSFGGFHGLAIPTDAPPQLDTTARSPIADHFIASLDRALRRPLAQIIANADSINGAADGAVAPDYADYAGDISHAARHLLGLVDDLVDLQAVERPDFLPVVDVIDLADVARRAAGLLAVRASEAGVMIERPLPGVTLWARGDFRRVLQILVNLIGNAVRYSPRGTIVLVGLHRDGEGRASVSITDEGKGIALTDQARVFGKFERVDASEPGGNGLGLYIARRLAQAMDGNLTLASTPGEGACFTLSLPAEPSRYEDQHQA